MLKKIALGLSLSLASLSLPLCSSHVLAETAPLRGLLNDVKQISNADSESNRKREAEFNADLGQQKRMLATSRQRLLAAEEEQENLKSQFDENDLKLAELESLLQQRSGQLGEVFGVAKEVAAELSPILLDSMTSADYPNRTDELAFAESKRVPELKDLQNLWYQLQLEMTASGEIKQFETAVTDINGLSEETTVLRVGPFAAATADGRFLGWDLQQQQLAVLPTQPGPSSQQDMAQYQRGENTDVLIDPSRGQLFMLLDRMPKLSERLHQGGEVGYLIIGLGVIGLLVALYQMLRMTITELQVRKQLSQPAQLEDNNPLGRVLQAVSHSGLGLDQLELKVDEVILKELPKIERGQSIIKLLAAVAPLLGLLGTVVGMIATFQSITLFGTSDPKLMAGGISQALMTTVLGLVVAIPLLFCHSYLAAKSRRITQLLQEKSLGLLSVEPLKADERIADAA
ncbi:MotA/TolQ/ExbB proton channel family protein [Neptuniibacter sp.]|uniref:MotA/TolQ/ExbB proton channel family protein n=1 Tax=Neptuniibacter sp. TaxID=1962643 RepID=UPI002628239F|nr:MotA/TolQ/ExbB proton channel family protein [Neptuniibacter sp.]MCP4595283.1 MotA/TolQ/ExbB proton channel family protein [Neptuniibacter sp.]